MVEKNPFKMWGSWIGAVIGLIWAGYNLLILVAAGLAGGTNDACYGGFSLLYYPACLSEKLGLFGLALPIIAGFIIGWAIQVIIKKVFK